MEDKQRQEKVNYTKGATCEFIISFSQMEEAKERARKMWDEKLDKIKKTFRLED